MEASLFMNRHPPRIAAPLMVCASILAACGQAEVGVSPSPTEVAVATADVATVIPMDDLPGRMVAFRTAEIRPQVSGVVTRRLFTQGGDVTAGQPLFQIDPTPYRADSLAAQARFANQVNVQEGVAEAARVRLHLSDLRHRAGLEGRLEPLDARRASNAARQTLLSLRRDQLAAMVTLYAALGGGLEPAS